MKPEKLGSALTVLGKVFKANPHADARMPAPVSPRENHAYKSLAESGWVQPRGRAALPTDGARELLLEIFAMNPDDVRAALDAHKK